MRSEYYNLERCDRREIDEQNIQKKNQGEKKSPLKNNNEKKNLRDRNGILNLKEK